MELDITAVFCSIAPRDYSASVAEIGASAGADTWRAACDDSADYPILDTDEKREAFRAFVRDSGGWDDAEIAAWSDTELNALCLQWIAGDMRESGINAPVSDIGAIDWDAIERDQQAGRIPSRIFRGTNNRVYFYIGS